MTFYTPGSGPLQGIPDIATADSGALARRESLGNPVRNADRTHRGRSAAGAGTVKSGQGCGSLRGMSASLREVTGVVLVLAALATLFIGVTELRTHDYLACIILTFTGLSLMRAGAELLRPSVGE
jgi:hypothetical protein